MYYNQWIHGKQKYNQMSEKNKLFYGIKNITLLNKIWFSFESVWKSNCQDQCSHLTEFRFDKRQSVAILL